MRTVLNTQAIAHAWVHQTQGHARNSGDTISFNGNSICSYRAEIGRILPDGSYALASRSWSMNTSGHQSGVRRAIPADKNVIHVYEIDQVGRVIVKHQRMAKELVERAATARTKRDAYLAEARGLLDNANAYAAAYGEAIRCDDTIIPATEDLAQLKPFIEKRKQEAKEVKAARQREANERLAEKVARWKKGDSEVQARMIDGASCVLRISGNIVETSHGASVPLDHATRLWPIVCKVRDSGKARSGLSIRIGHYTLTSITADGSVTIGCHNIAFSELSGIAQQLNLTAEASA